MLGRREEEAEREELERQMREQEEMELEMERGEELARQARLREEGGAEEAAQRDLDDEIPDADAHAQRTQHEHDEVEGEEDADLDDDIPDADAGGDNTFADEEDDNIEGETGMTDDVEHTNLGSGGNLNRAATTVTTPSTAMAPPGNRGAPNLNAQQARAQAQTAHQAHLRRREQEQEQEQEQQALADAMLDEDEQGFADRDLDAEIPDGDEDDAVLMAARDLDDDVPEADGNGEDEGGEWQHTDTELEEDESAVMLLEDDGNAMDGDVSMDMSGIAIQGGTRRSTSGATNANLLATPAMGDGPSMLHTPASTADMESGSAGRSWLNQRSIFGMGRGRTGNLFAGITDGASASGIGSPQGSTQSQPQAAQRDHHGLASQPEQGAQQPQEPARRRGRSARNASGRENRIARDSLD